MSTWVGVTTLAYSRNCEQSGKLQQEDFDNRKKSEYQLYRTQYNRSEVIQAVVVEFAAALLYTTELKDQRIKSVVI